MKTFKYWWVLRCDRSNNSYLNDAPLPVYRFFFNADTKILLTYNDWPDYGLIKPFKQLNGVLSDVEAVYVDMDDQIAASIQEAGDGRVNFSANLTSVIESFDATEFTVEADYGQYSDSTSFILSTYKLPVLETTLLVDEVNENMNETLRFIDCAINGKFSTYTTRWFEQYLYSEAGYKPKERDFGFVAEDVVIKIGNVELLVESG